MRAAICVFLAFVACASALTFVEEGKEYVYDTEGGASAGTMDYATHTSGFSMKMKTRVQASGNTLNIKFENMKFSQFVGAHDAKAWPYDDTTFTPARIQNPPAFQIRLGSDGLFEELIVPSDASLMHKNIMRGWAAQLQMNSAEIKKGIKGFKSREQLLEGNCDVTYTLAPGVLRKTVAHAQDCEDRNVRIIDDYRGMFCTKQPQTPDYPSSLASTTFITEPKGDKYQVNAIISTGSFIAQWFEEEGSAQFIFTNSTSKLVEVKASSGDINPSGESIKDLAYEWADKAYKWDVDRDLKAREPLFGSGQYYKDETVAELKDAIRNGISLQKNLMENMDTDKETIQKAHRFGPNNVLPAFFALDYDSLKSLADEFFADKSDTGIFKANVFAEMLANTGTTASALLVRDMVLAGKFDNDRDAARILTSVPYHIRRPNTQLVREFEKLLGQGDRFVQMAAPLALGHLVRITCERAGPFKSAETLKCVKTFASTYVQKFWNEYKATNDKREKSHKLGVLMNLRYGGQSELLKDLIYGKMEQDDLLRTQALWASGWEALMSGKGTKYFMPIFADRTLSHELRIGALEMLMYSRPAAADLSTVMAVLYSDKDYEVINYAHSLLERYATSVDPCMESTRELAQYYFKYMKQWSGRTTDWGFGVSKTYARQFYKKKYGYANNALFYVIGSKESTTPLTIGFGLSKTYMNSYHNFIGSAHIRIEGLAKALLRKFKTMDPATWKTSDLEKILSGDMAIREREDQPVRVSINIMVKGNVVFYRQYDETDAGPDGKLGSFLSNLKGLGETYNINHQRALQLGSFMYEQPTVLGIPMVSISSYTSLFHITATVKRGNHRGLLYRDVSYDAQAFVQANRLVMVPLLDASYGIVNDRIYFTRLPRKFVIGVNPIKKELKLSISRPGYDKPLRFIRHSQTTVMVRGHNVKGDYNRLQANCPGCQNRVVVSKGPQAIKSRAFIDRTNKNVGSYLYGEYFDCEMDISRGNAIRNLIGAFMPYNKNSRTPYNLLVTGFQQIRAFIFYFPKNEQCGAQLRWSQSKENPVNEVEISIRGKVEENGNRMFFRGRKWFIKALIKAKGEPEDRSYRVNVAYEFTPGKLQNSVKIQLNRAPVAALGMKPYSACIAYESAYPDFSKEFLDFDASNDMSVSGKAMVQYGEGTQCSETNGEIKVAFKHSTTALARDELKNKWFYKQCMATKNTPAWSGKKGYPLTEACYQTVWDASAARKYTWNIEFVKLSDRMKRILNKVRTAVKAGLLPYWDLDPETMGAEGEIGPFMKLEAVLKNDEKNADIKVETRQGEEEFKDVALRLNWTKRLRQLKLTSMLKRLFQARIINPCVVTSQNVRTMDNVTYSYDPSSCWTLASAHCGPRPAYAVFTKKAGAMPIAMRAFIGGHQVEMNPTGPGAIDVKLNGNSISVGEGESYVHTVDGVEILKVMRWGSTYQIYSFLKVWISFDGNFAEVVPAPSTKGQHCGICGNYNRNQFDEFTAKDMSQLSSASDMVENWKWQC